MNPEEFNILIVEDQQDNQLLIKAALGNTWRHNYAQSLSEARLLLDENSYDLILLDVMLEDGNGFQFFSELRSSLSIESPVIFLTAKGAVEDKVFGLSLGAEDYIVKPFNPMELKARIVNKINLSLNNQKKAQVRKLQLLEINMNTQNVYYRDGSDRSIDLSTLEFKLLCCLTKNIGHVLSREQILNSVWGNGTYVLDRSVDSMIASLRKKIGKPASGSLKAVHGCGYRWTELGKKQVA